MWVPITDYLRKLLLSETVNHEYNEKYMYI